MNPRHLDIIAPRATSADTVIEAPRGQNARNLEYAQFLEDNGVVQMANKGRIKKGPDADLTIFDPATVTDNSTIPKGLLPATGIPYVVVNGTLIV